MPDAMFRFGECARLGVGRPVDFGLARTYLEMADGAGFPGARAALDALPSP
jgi:TPR repeat protein